MKNIIYSSVLLPFLIVLLFNSKGNINTPESFQLESDKLEINESISSYDRSEIASSHSKMEKDID